MSLDQFLPPPEDGNVHELLEGEQLMSPRPNWWHVELQRRLQQRLNAAVSGACFVYQGMAYQLNSRTLLEPDVSAASAELVARAEPDGWLAGAPLVAVEIVSLPNMADELARKVKVYLQAGTSEERLAAQKAVHT
jgi:Uma2 family endonuclease